MRARAFVVVNAAGVCMTPATLTILKQIHGDAWRLAGPANRRTRQAVLSDLTGRKVTAADAGVNNIRAELIRLANIDTAGKCIAEIDRDLAVWVETVPQ